MWRLFLGLARVGVAWVPALVLLWWGAAYVDACYRTVLSPGEPISYGYESTDGVVTVRADNYIVDVVGQRLLLKGLTLTKPGGQLVAKASEAVLANGPGSYHVRLKSVFVALDRGKDGQIDVKGLLPKPTGQPDKTRIEVEADQVTVEYRDLTGADPITRRVVVKDLNVARADGDTLVWADIQNAAKVAAWVKANNDWSADVRLAGDDLAWLVPVARQWAPDQGGDWSAEHISGQGRLTVASTAGQVTVHGDVDLDAAGLTVGKTLQKASIYAQVHGGLEQVRVSAKTTEPGRTASFDGVLAFGKTVTAAGRFRATVRSRADAWPVLADVLPKGVDFTGAVYSGSVSVRDSKPTVVGDLTADRVAGNGLALAKVTARLGVEGDRVAAEVKNMEFSGLAWSGRLDLNTKSGALTGYAATDDDFGKLLPAANRKEVVAPGRVTVLLGGTADHLLATVDASAKIGWIPDGRPGVELGNLDARATLRDGKVTLDRCLLRGAVGTAKLSGSVSITDKTLDLTANVPGVRLDPFFDTVQGSVATDIKISGPFDMWTMKGRAEAYGVETPELTIPQVVAEFSGNAKTVVVEELRARLLGGRLLAAGHVDLPDGAVALQFSAEDLDVSRLTGDEVVGQLEVSDGLIGGSLNALVAHAKASSVGFAVGGVRVDDASAFLSYDGEDVTVSSAVATVGGGKVTASGSVDIEDLAMSLAGEWHDVKLASLVPSALDLSTEGTTSGRFVWDDPGIGNPVGKAEIDLDGLKLAHLDLGSGQLTALLDGRNVTASGTIGSIDRYIQLSNFDYDTESQEITVGADIAEFGLQQTVVAALARTDDVSPETRALVQSLGGSVSAHVDLSGTTEALSVTVPRLTVRDITAEGRPMGDLVASGGLNEGRWTLDDLLWSKGEARVDAKGSVDAQNNIAGKLEVVGLEMADVAAFIPNVDVDKGKASATVVFSGKTDAPKARGSAKLEELVLRDGTGRPVPVPLTVNASEIDWRDGMLVGGGDFTVATQQVQGGLTGAFTLRLPTTAWGVDSDRPVGVDVLMDDRPLAALAGLWPEIEEKGTAGKVSAEIHISGKSGDILVGGEAKVTADEKGVSTLKLKSIAEPLRDVDAHVLLGGRSATVAASVTSPFGGKAALTATLDAEEAFRQAFSPENLLSGGSVQAKLTMSDIKWKGRMTGTDKDSSFSLDGEISADGNLDEPVVGGRVELHGTSLTLAPGLPPGSTPDKPLFDPMFNNLTIVADHGTQINVATATVNLYGTGTLAGSLSDPNFNADFRLDSGTLRLPTNRITLEEDGRLRVLAEGYPPTIRVDVDLTGHTIATARSSTDQYQTYSINLDIKGNLLGEEPLQIQGTSDPPDLSNEQIMAILGERQLIETLAASALGRGSSQDLRDSLYSVAVPTLTQGLTENLAQGLGLDYLLLDYNPLDQAVIRFGKSLGKGLMLQGVKQLAQPTFGKQKYEIGLSYRPPFKGHFFDRVRFTLAQDQDVPWRVGVTWSIRF